jgi:phosphoribosylformylglycinamidine cyclo-ligase
LRGTLGEELLAVHLSYGPLTRAVLKKFEVKGMAHITGGGFIDNLPRVLPKKCDALIKKGSWDMPRIFQLLAANGGVEERELYQVFNMGIGMTLVIAAEKADAALRFIRARGQAAWIIGEIVRGAGLASVV